MIEEVVLTPGRKTELPTCRSVLYAGAARGTVLSDRVLLRQDDVPAGGIPLAPGQGVYWPQSDALKLSVENPSESLDARVQWSTDSDITRYSPEPRSRLLDRLLIDTMAPVETELARVALIPEMIRADPVGYGQAETMPVGDVTYILPSGPIRRPARRTTISAYNTSPAALTLRLYGLSYPHLLFPRAVLLETLVLGVDETGYMDAVVDGFSAMILTYVEDTPTPGGTVLWQLHEGGTFVPYTKAEVDALLAAYMPLAGGTFGGAVDWDVAGNPLFSVAPRAGFPDRLDLGVAQETRIMQGLISMLQLTLGSYVRVSAPNGLLVNGQIVVYGRMRCRDQVSAYLASNQSIPTNTWTKVTLTESFDTGGHFASSRFTAAIDGYYQVSANAQLENIGGGKRAQAAIYKNGVNVALACLYAAVVGNIEDPQLSVSKLIHLAAGEHLELWVWHDHPGNREVRGYGRMTFLTVLGPF